MSRLIRDLSSETYVTNPDTSRGTVAVSRVRASLEESAAHGDTSQRDSVRCPIGLPMAIARFPARKHLASVVIVGAQREGGWAPAT